MCYNIIVAHTCRHLLFHLVGIYLVLPKFNFPGAPQSPGQSQQPQPAPGIPVLLVPAPYYPGYYPCYYPGFTPLCVPPPWPYTHSTPYTGSLCKFHVFQKMPNSFKWDGWGAAGRGWWGLGLGRERWRVVLGTGSLGGWFIGKWNRYVVAGIF